jgi:peptidoglycan/xylan/chitin deacetylase (PgdA/CDA1 family)
MTILCYHTVQPDWISPLAVTPARFAEHCAWLARERDMLDLADGVAILDRDCRLPRRTAALTFDDGFASVYEYALPLLRRYRLPATVFLVAGTLAPGHQPVDWVEPSPPQAVATLTVDQVLELHEAGVRFGSHSFTHRDLTLLSERECTRDLRDSRELLETLLRQRVDLLAYPRGRHSTTVRRAAARAGYAYGFTLPESAEPAGPYAIPRVGVYPANGTGALRLKCSPWYIRVRTARAYPALRLLVRGRRHSVGQFASLAGMLPRGWRRCAAS